MKAATQVLHCLNLIAGACITGGYAPQWMGITLLATASLDAYLTTQLPKS